MKIEDALNQLEERMRRTVGMYDNDIDLVHTAANMLRMIREEAEGYLKPERVWYSGGDLSNPGVVEYDMAQEQAYTSYAESILETIHTLEHYLTEEG